MRASSRFQFPEKQFLCQLKAMPLLTVTLGGGGERTGSRARSALLPAFVNKVYWHNVALSADTWDTGPAHRDVRFVGSGGSAAHLWGTGHLRPHFCVAGALVEGGFTVACRMLSLGAPCG